MPDNTTQYKNDPLSTGRRQESRLRLHFALTADLILSPQLKSANYVFRQLDSKLIRQQCRSTRETMLHNRGAMNCVTKLPLLLQKKQVHEPSVTRISCHLDFLLGQIGKARRICKRNLAQKHHHQLRLEMARTCGCHPSA